MSIESPTPEEARAALARATERGDAVRASDRLFGSTLLVIAGAAVIGQIFMAYLPMAGHQWWSSLAVYIVFTTLLVGSIVAVVLVHNRVRAYTRTAHLMFKGTIAVFMMWYGFVTTSTYHEVWSVPTAPSQRSLYFVVAALVLVAPLLLAAIVFRLRR